MGNCRATGWSTKPPLHSRWVRDTCNPKPKWTIISSWPLWLFFCGQLYVDTGLDTELSLNLSAPLSNVSFRVCAYTGAGRGPWTPTQTLTLISPGEWPIVHVHSTNKNHGRHRLDSWWKMSPFSLFPQKWRNSKVSHFFWLSNSLCCDLLEKKQPIITATEDIISWRFFHHETSPFLILCHGLRVSSCESQKGGRNRKRRREELRHSEWGRGLNRRHVINIYNRRRQWRISVCSGSRRRAERSNEKKSRLKRGRESAGDWAWTGARELWMESQKIAHEGMKTLGNKYN